MTSTDPSLPALPDDPRTAEIEVAERLAERLGLNVPRLAQAIGGGWRPVPRHRLTGLLPEPSHWLGAGSPLQVLLGITEARAIVAAPDEFSGGLAGPPTLDASNPVEIDLTAPDRDVALANAVSATLQRTRRGWQWCWGCRNYLPAIELNGHAGVWCSGCSQRYLKIIAC